MRNRSWLCFLEDRKHSCTDAACFGASTGDLMSIDGVGCVGIRMAKFVSSGHGVYAAGDQNRCHSMTECVGVDVGQVVNDGLM